MAKVLCRGMMLGIVLIGIAGCDTFPNYFLMGSPDEVTVYLVNQSTSKYVSPNPGLCPQGLEAAGHSFLDDRPMLAPGQMVSVTTRQIDPTRGDCSNADPTFMLGLCGWNHGDDPQNLTACTQRYGGQIGYQFQCGDTVILRWTDEGSPDGTWTSDVITAPGNAAPSAAFQLMESSGSCTL